MKYFQAASMPHWCGKMPTIITVVRVASSIRHPHESDVVRQQREIHGKHQQLVHGVIEAQIPPVSRRVCNSCAM